MGEEVLEVGGERRRYEIMILRVGGTIDKEDVV